MRKARQERRAEIASAALVLLAEQGPRQLTARNLGAMVGMDGSSLFRHFPNKAAILHAAIDVFEQHLAASFPDAEPSWESLRSFFLHRLELVRERPEVIHLAFGQHLMVSGEKEHATRVAEIVGRSFGFLRRCLQHARDEGRLPTDVPVEAQVWVVTGVIRGAALGATQSDTAPLEVWRWLASLLQQKERS